MTKGIILAVCTFAMGAIVFSFSLYTITLEEQLQTNEINPGVAKNVSQHFKHAFGLRLDKKSIDTIVSFILLLSLLTMVVSILLVIGIKKNKPSFIVAYFSFGSLLCLLLVVSAVLELLQRRWSIAAATASLAFIFTERLSTVLSIYENMIKDSDLDSLLPENQSSDLTDVPFDNVNID